MTNNMRDILMVVAGAVIGAIVTSLYYSEKEYKMLQDEADFCEEMGLAIKKYEPGRVNPVKEKVNEADEAWVKANPNLERRDEDKVLVLKDERFKKLATPYQTMMKVVGKEERGFNESPTPYVITSEQFGEEMDHHDKLTIEYYALDNTLVDDGEEIISDVEATIGDAILSFGDGSDDADVVYVRNEKMAIDYEVIRLNKSYSETVLG